MNVGGRPLDSDALRKPTILTMPQEEQAKCVQPSEGSPGGCDEAFLQRGIQFGLFNALRRKAMFLSASNVGPELNGKSVNGFLNGDSKHHNGVNGHSNGHTNGHSNGNTGGVGAKDEWTHLEIVVAWCEQSVWVLPYGMLELKAELAEAKSKGIAMRDVRFVRLRGVNHVVSDNCFRSNDCRYE